MALAILLALIASIVWLGLFGLGVAVTWRGIRGRLVDRAARCAKCRYNVSAGGVRPSRCPECGTSLQGIGTVRLGLRRPRPPLIAVGALMILASLTPTGLLIDFAAAPAAPPAPVVVQGPRPTTPAQDARRRQMNKDFFARNQIERDRVAPHELMGPPAPPPPPTSDTDMPAPPPILPSDSGTTPPMPASFDPWLNGGDPYYDEAPTSGMALFDFGSATGTPQPTSPLASFAPPLAGEAITQGQTRLLRPRYQPVPGAGAMHQGDFGLDSTWSVVAPTPISGDFATPHRLQSTLIQPSVTGTAAGRHPLGSSPVRSISTGPTTPTGPTAIPAGPKPVSPIR